MINDNKDVPLLQRETSGLQETSQVWVFVGTLVVSNQLNDYIKPLMF